MISSSHALISRYLKLFSARLLNAFEGTYEGALEHYPRSEVAREMDMGTNYLS